MTSPNGTTTLAPLTKADTPSRAMMFNELGSASDSRVAGRLYEDFHPKLKGRQALRVYDEMRLNDATVAAWLYAVDTTIRQVAWHAQPAGELTADVAAAEWLDEQRTGMTHTWPDLISQALMMIPFGWAFHEVVYKLDEGRVGWLKMPLQPHTSFIQWNTDAAGEITGLVERHGNSRVTIPIEKGVLFQANAERRSVLRTSYRAWYFRKHLQEVEAIGVERDLTGLPRMKIPAHVLLDTTGTELAMWKNVVTRTKRDEQEGLLIPSDRDENGHPLYEFDLVTTGGSRAFDTSAIIRRYSVEILQTVLADWLALGTDAVGSRALADPKLETFRTGLEATLDSMAATLNQQAVRRLFAVNSIPTPSGIPRLVHAGVKEHNLEEFGQFILRTAQAGADWFDDVDGESLEPRLRDMAGIT